MPSTSGASMIPGKLQEEFLWVCTNHCLLNKAGILKFLSSLTAGQRVLWAPVPRRPAKDADATAKFVQHILMLCLIWFPGWDEFYEQVFWLIRWLILLKLEYHFPSDSSCFAQIWDKSLLHSLERPVIALTCLPGLSGQYSGTEDQEPGPTSSWVTISIHQFRETWAPTSSGLLSDQGKVYLGTHFWFPSGDFNLYHLSRLEPLPLHRALQLLKQGGQATSKDKSDIKALFLKFALRPIEISPNSLIIHIPKVFPLLP